MAEIKKLRKKNDAYNKPSHIADVCYEETLSLIDTLEVKEEVLDEEGKAKLMKKCVHKAYKRGYDMGVLKTINEMNHNIKEVDLDAEIEKCLKQYSMLAVGKKDFTDIAKYFFEFGLNAQKGE